MKKILLLLTFIFLSACETTKTAAPTANMIELNGTAIEVQNFIELNKSEIIGKYSDKFKLITANDRSISFEAECADVKTVGFIKCAGILLAVGNSGWDGPFLTISFRTNEIRDKTTVRSTYQWCAVNLIGKQNCGLESIPLANDLLKKIETNFGT